MIDNKSFEFGFILASIMWINLCIVYYELKTIRDSKKNVRGLGEGPTEDPEKSGEVSPKPTQSLHRKASEK